MSEKQQQIPGPETPAENDNEWRVTQYEDGFYRWVGEINLYKNPTILFMVWKIFFWIIFAMFVVMNLFDLGNSDFFWKGFLENLKFSGIFTGGFFLLCLIGYLVYAMMNGGRYTVMFEMGDEGFSHTQIPAQARKAQTISAATFFTGALTGNFTTMGVGMNASRTSMDSEWNKVKSIQGFPRRGVIKVNETMNKNQLYMLREDYDMVWEFVKEHCPNAKIK